MKNKKIVYVENKDDLVELLNNEVEKSPQNKRMPIILRILLSMAIIAAGYFGFRLWRYYQDYQDDQKLYGDLREAVLQVNDEPELPTEEIQSTEKLMSESSVKKQRIKKKKDQLQFEGRTGRNKQRYYWLGIFYRITANILPNFAGRR